MFLIAIARLQILWNLQWKCKPIHVHPAGWYRSLGLFGPKELLQVGEALKPSGYKTKGLKGKRPSTSLPTALIRTRSSISEPRRSTRRDHVGLKPLVAGTGTGGG